MTGDTLEIQLTWANNRLSGARAALEGADRLRERAREMGGGLLSFGGSGSQRAAQQVSSATERGMRAWHEAHEKVEYWEHKVASIEWQIKERDRVRLTRDDLIGATHVRIVNGGWWRVAKLNRTTVSVVTGYSWTDRHEFSKIAEARTIADPASIRSDTPKES